MTAAKIRRVGYDWKLRQVMADHDMFQTTDLIPHLAERGIELSSVQVYRLVAQVPERLNLTVLAALCDIFGCTPADLIVPTAENVTARRRRTAGEAGKTSDAGTGGGGRRPTRARIVDDGR
ncbi:helix-turn-helix transcriptional regulator [Nitriliruptoraceae bacterium ZYF776]|nr:helix-turn-helix transcriptional regulator [Profundirhabdus halotolerans]